MAQQVQQATGLILAVQEQRFRLFTESGQSLLLTLANASRTRYEDLVAWKDRNQPVTVFYTGEPNFARGVAYRFKAGPPAT